MPVKRDKPRRDRGSATRTALLAVLSLAGIAALAKLSCKLNEPVAQLRSGASVTGEAIRAPLQGSVQVVTRPGYVTLNLDLRDADGREISALRLPGRPAAPKVRVLDGAGREVYKCTLEYG